jgi:hypothetical protein
LAILSGDDGEVYEILAKPGAEELGEKKPEPCRNPACDKVEATLSIAGFHSKFFLPILWDMAKP